MFYIHHLTSFIVDRVKKGLKEVMDPLEILETAVHRDPLDQ